MSQKKLVIAIDGPAASGKSTTAKLVAQRLGYLHVDSGAMYRAITLKVLRAGIELNDNAKVISLVAATKVELEPVDDSLKILLDGVDVTREIRSFEVTKAVSAISSIREVRTAMVREQQKLIQRGGIVMDGRDIGTVVASDADLKIFMSAGIDKRAHRRSVELIEKGLHPDPQMLKQEIIERDRLDSTRNESPLKKASDAIELDTSNMTIDEQVEFIVRKVKELQ